MFGRLKDLMDRRPLDYQDPGSSRGFNQFQKLEGSILVPQDVENIEELLEYIYLLFEERQYYHGARLWDKINYANFLQARFAKNIDFLKIVIRLKDEQIAQMMAEGSKYKSPHEIIGEDKINQIVYAYFKERDGKIGDLQRQNEELDRQNRELKAKLDKLQNQLELVTGDKDFAKRQADKAKKEADQLAKDLQLYKETAMGELQDKYEKEIGALNAEIRQLKKQIAKLQQDLALANEMRSHKS